MKIQINDLEPIVIPDELLTDLHPKKFDAKTSYLDRVCSKLKKKSYIEGALPLKLQCLWNYRDLNYGSSLIDGLGSCVMIETMAGIGLTGRVLEKEVGPGMQQQIFNETDEKCKAVLGANFKGVGMKTLIASDNAFEGPNYAIDGYCAIGLAFLDFNNFTFKRFLSDETYKGALMKAFEASNKYVIVNDCSIFYFRYGKKSHEVYSRLTGRIITGPLDYFCAVRDHFEDLKIGWKLVRVEYFKETAFLLFEKTEEGRIFQINENTKENLKLKVTVTP